MTCMLVDLIKRLREGVFVKLRCTSQRGYRAPARVPRTRQIKTGGRGTSVSSDGHVRHSLCEDRRVSWSTNLEILTSVSHRMCGKI